MKIGKAVSADGFYKYKVLAYKGEYALVCRHTSFQPYVVAWLPEMDGNVLTWGQGHYFNDWYEACAYYESATEADE